MDNRIFKIVETRGNKEIVLCKSRVFDYEDWRAVETEYLAARKAVEICKLSTYRKTGNFPQLDVVLEKAK